jgi:hypothetical protein
MYPQAKIDMKVSIFFVMYKGYIIAMVEILHFMEEEIF